MATGPAHGESGVHEGPRTFPTMPRGNQSVEGMLRELRLNNLKPFGSEQRAALAPITLIYGPNSAGKSSLVQALLLIRQSLDARGQGDAGYTRLVPSGRLVDLGSFRSLVHGHETERRLTLGLGWDGGHEDGAIRGIDLRFDRPEGETPSVSYRLRDPQGAMLLDVSLEWRLEDRRFVWKKGIESVLDYTRDYEGDECPGKRHYGLSRRRRARPSEHGRRADLVRWMRRNTHLVDRHGLPSRIEVEEGKPQHPWETRGPRILEAIAEEHAAYLDSITYLGPLRCAPARHYVPTGEVYETVGTRGQFTPHILHREHETRIPEINRWFERFEIPYELSVDAIGNELTGEIIVLALMDRETRVTVAPSDVGFGIGQLLPILVDGVVARDRIICVEQPEIHLHPRLQAHTADFMIHSAGLQARALDDVTAEPLGNQWIVETHSEALMLRLQRRIREATIRADDVSVLYVFPGTRTGSEVMELRLDQDGEFIDEWPDGFFEEGYREMFGGKA